MQEQRPRKEIRCPICGALFFEVTTDSVATIIIKCRKCHKFVKIEVGRQEGT